VSGDPYLSLSTRLEFALRHKVAHLVVRQVNYATVITGLETAYLADGTTTRTLTVKSNCPWTAEVEDDDEIFLAGSLSTLSGAGNTTTGETFTFTLDERVNTANNTNVNALSATVTFKKPDGLTLGTATITSHAQYMTIQASYPVANFAGHSFDVSINTNIPLVSATNPLTASVTNTSSGKITAATIVPASKKLRVTVTANTSSTTTSGTVQVKYGTKITRSMTVNFPISPYDEVDGRLVTKATKEFKLETFYLNTMDSYNPCPSPSSGPTTREQATWYLTYFSQNAFINGTIAYMTWHNSNPTPPTPNLPVQANSNIPGPPSISSPSFILGLPATMWAYNSYANMKCVIW
jgi:hypothetical protein